MQYGQCKYFLLLPYLPSQTCFDVRDRSSIFDPITRHRRFREMWIMLDLLYVDDDSMSLEDFDKIFTTFMAERHICVSGEYYA